MCDDLSPIERCIQGWELTRELLAEDMAEIRRYSNLVHIIHEVVQMENADDHERDERSAVGA